MGKQSGAAQVRTSWDRIEAWLVEHVPQHARQLAKGATPAALTKAETRLEVVLPDPVKDSLLIHDGQREEFDLIPDGFGTFFLMRLKDITAEWAMLNELQDVGEFADFSADPDAGVANDWWNRGWIPMASNGGGDYLCVDLAPTEQGTVGQIIKVHHDDPARPLLAPSFDVWLAQLATALEDGELDDNLG